MQSIYYCSLEFDQSRCVAALGCHASAELSRWVPLPLPRSATPPPPPPPPCRIRSKKFRMLLRLLDDEEGFRKETELRPALTRARRQPWRRARCLSSTQTWYEMTLIRSNYPKPEVTFQLLVCTVVSTWHSVSKDFRLVLIVWGKFKLISGSKLRQQRA